MLDRLIRFAPKFSEAGLALAAVTQGKPGEARLFCQSRAPGLHCLADPERNAYRAFGLGRINVFKGLISSKGRKSRAEARAHGHAQEMPPDGQDVMQTAGLFIIGANGRLVFAHRYEFAGDHPPFDEVLSSAKTLTPQLR